MSLFLVIVLAIVQGVAEFLPISSSGHLVIVAALLRGWDNPTKINIIDVSIVLHMGTLLSILVYYHKRLWRLVTQDWRTCWLVVVGTIPAATIGLFIKKRYEWVLGDPLLAGCLLVCNGMLLWFAGRPMPERKQLEDLTVADSLGIGLAQAVAVLPGISRSGSTIVAGLVSGLKQVDAATFSFLLAIPAIGGASFLQFLEFWQGEPCTTRWSYLAIGGTLSFVIGLFSLHLLMTILERRKLSWFAYWSLLAGLGVIVWHVSHSPG